MNLSGVKAEDIIYCDVRGDRFYASVEERQKQGPRLYLAIKSLTGRPIPALRVTARQVVAHWRKSKASKV
jgi:hypothetical protein